MSTTFTRRHSLGLMGAALASPLFPAPALATQANPATQASPTAKIPDLALYGPPAGPSVTMAHAVAQGRFDTIAQNTSFNAWRNPDELRAGLVSKTIALSVVPVQAAANLYNRGFPIKLANVMTNGLLYVISAQPGLSGIKDLKGLKLAVPFKGDTPELLFARLVDRAGLRADTDLQITYTGTPIEAMQLLLAGRVDAALTAEPASTAAILRAKMAGKTLYRSIDLQQAWADMEGVPPVLPQAGLAVTGAFLDHHATHLPQMLSAIETATVETLADPETAAASAAKVLTFPMMLLAASVPHCHLVARPAQEARSDIERMLGTMGGAGLKKIGGKLPDTGFYL